MPRRKRAFINRSEAKTFQLVHRPTQNDPSHQVFLPVNGERLEPEASLNSGQNADGIDVSEFGQEYDTIDYELGEYGFPEDGYNYSKHFKTIGGGGGVFMDAATGLPNPDAVGPSSGKAETGFIAPKDSVLLKDDIPTQVEDENNGIANWRSPEDEEQRLQAIAAIKRDMKRDKDLEEIFAALDSDGELESSPSDTETEETLRETEPDTNAGLLGSDGTDDLLEDDFVAFADESHEKTPLDGVIDAYREPRLLDEQFEKFMQEYQLDTSDDEEDYEEELRNKAKEMEEAKDYLTAEELQGFLKDDDLLKDFSELNIEVTENDEGDNVELNEAEIEEDPAPDGDGMDTEKRKQEFSEYTAAEFERGMKGLLDSYTRVTAEEAFEAVDGLSVARQALLRGEEEERETLRKRAELGLADDEEYDPELDEFFDDLLKEKDEKWDCETVLSTYTNLDNHPSVIDAPTGRKRQPVQRQPIIRLDPRTQAPAEFLPAVKDGPSRSDATDYGSRRDNAVTAVRTKNESKEEKKARKAAVKEAARERRALKSEMKKAFGAESVKQGRHATALGTSKVAVKF